MFTKLYKTKRTMRKLTFILMMTLCLTFTACHNTENAKNKISNVAYSVDKVKIDNHDYILAKCTLSASGISIIHSDSCECKKRKNK